VKGSQKIIDALNGLLAMELAAMDQYFIHSQMYQDWGCTSSMSALPMNSMTKKDMPQR